MEHSGPTLPVDFAPHLLVRICDAILEPLLSPQSPLKPYTKPWGRATTASWQTSSALHSMDSPDIYTSSSRRESVNLGIGTRGSTALTAKSDILAFVSCRKDIWIACGDMIHRHVRVSSLAIADVLVSRRSCLTNTRVMELYITREIEASQAQTDLNLARFFIQAGILLLWSPCLHTIILDIRALPAEPHIWASFISRLRQRLFITPPQVPPQPARTLHPRDSALIDSLTEASFHAEVGPRWTDSQGVFNSPNRVSIPHFAIGLSYGQTGNILRGFGGVLDAIFAHHPPTATENGLPGMLARPGHFMTSIITTRNLATLTTLNLLVPRPAWSQEELEGMTLGFVLRRLANLRHLGLHADGSIQQNSTNAEFGLMSRPPYNGAGIEGDSSDDEADMAIMADGTVTYQTRKGSLGGHQPSTPNVTATTNVNPIPTSRRIEVGSSGSISSEAGYGAERWWAGIFHALSVPEGYVEEQLGMKAEFAQSIHTLRISVAVPGGNVEVAHFDAFFEMVVPYFQNMVSLQTLVFDMSFAAPQQSDSLMIWKGEGSKRVSPYDRQRYYVERVLDRSASSLPFVGSGVGKPMLTNYLSEPTTSRTSMGAGRENKRFTLDDSTSESARKEFGDMGSAIPIHVEGTGGSSDEVFAPSLRHVYFGEYYGLPPFAPSDWETSLRDGSSTVPPPGTIVDGAHSLGEKKSNPSFIKGVTDKATSNSSNSTANGRVNRDISRSLPGMWWTIAPVEAVAPGMSRVTQGWKESVGDWI